MFAYLRFELRRRFREPGLMLFTVLMPVASYVIFTGVGQPGGSNDFAVTLMIGMAGYGALIGVLSLGASVSVERTQGWLRQLRVTPLSSRAVITVKAITCTVVTIPSIVAIGITAYIQHHVQLSVGRWVLVLAVMWAGSIPFALLGLSFGYALRPNVAQPASFMSFFSLAVLGGLLVPTEAFPKALQHLAHVLPSNRYGELGWRAVAGRPPTMTGLAVLLGWTAAFAVIAAVAYRKSDATR
jgi:ABC-2 type transport system permease protein